MAKILVFAGSTRSESFNRKLATVAAAAAEQTGAVVTHIELADYPMPLFNQDLEASEGMPDSARQFKQQLIDHDGFIIASPEYNSAFSPLMKNVIDWASRSEVEGEPPLAAYRGKTALLLAASPGALGGLRGLVHLRMVLSNIGVYVIPDQLAVSSAFNAFEDDEPRLADAGQQQKLERIVWQLVDTTDKLHS